MLDWAFTVLGLHNVDLRVVGWNKQAIHCYEKAGLRQAASSDDCRVAAGGLAGGPR